MKRPGRIALLVIALICLAVELAAGWYSSERDDAGSGAGYVMMIGAFALVLCVAALVYGVLFFRNSRLELTPGELVHRNWRGRTRRLPRNRIARVAKARYLTDTGGVRNADVLTVIADTDGRTISFGSGYWPEEELGELWRRLGAPYGQWLAQETPTVREFRRLHRVRLPPYHAHFQMFTSLVVLGTTVTLIALLAVAVLLFG